MFRGLIGNSKKRNEISAAQEIREQLSFWRVNLSVAHFKTADLLDMGNRNALLFPAIPQYETLVKQLTKNDRLILTVNIGTKEYEFLALAKFSQPSTRVPKKDYFEYPFVEYSYINSHYSDPIKVDFKNPAGAGQVHRILGKNEVSELDKLIEQLLARSIEI